MRKGLFKVCNKYGGQNSCYSSVVQGHLQPLAFSFFLAGAVEFTQLVSVRIRIL